MASFRRSKSSLSGHSDEETYIDTMNYKKPDATMQVCMEDPRGEECFSDRFSH